MKEFKFENDVRRYPYSLTKGIQGKIQENTYFDYEDNF